MTTCITCKSESAEVYKASFGAAIVCRRCDPISDAVVVSTSDECSSAALVFARELRRRGIRTECDTRNAKLKKKLELASKCGAYYVIVFGEDEIARGTCQVKDLDAKPSDPNKQLELSTGAAVCLLEYMLVPGGKVSGRIEPQQIIEIG